jgi:hypothetical protein
MLFYYTAPYINVISTYKASNIVFSVHGDTSYPEELRTRRRTGRHFYMSDNSIQPPNNGAVLGIVHMKNSMSSAVDAKMRVFL